MRLIIREYLGMLKESGEFDALLPDLLLAMKIVPLSKPQIGVRQAGVDIAAVGNDNSGRLALWLFLLKRGDLGRRDWDVGSQSVRQSLDEIRDVYLRNHVAPEHVGLPVKIIVVTTGDFKQEIDQNRVGYADANSLPDRTYGFWNGDQVAELLEQHLLNEYALPGPARSQLRRALALIGEHDYDLSHFYTLLRTLLDWGSEKKAAKAHRECLRALLTISLSLGIICRWAGQEGNLRSAVIACERTLLWSWDAIRSRGLTQKDNIIKGYVRLIELYLATTVEYFNKVQSHLHTKDALARYYSEAALLTERVFEEIGLVASIGLSHLLWGVTTKNKHPLEGAGAVSFSLESFLKTHRCSGSPSYDGQAIDISLGLLLLLTTGKEQQAKEWVRELIGRLIFGFRVGRWFPISTDSFDDLISFEIDRENTDIEKLKETSWMVPIIAQWAAALGEDEAYVSLIELRENVLKNTCFQLWYPDEKTDQVLYLGPAHFESGISEAPLDLPPTADGMRAHIEKTRSESPVKEHFNSSASKAGLIWLDLIASRHFRTPIDPAYWQQLHAVQFQPTQGSKKDKEDVTINAKPDVPLQVKQLISVLEGDMSRGEIQAALGLSTGRTLTNSFLRPALDSALIEMIIPGKPHGRKQHFRLTNKGRQLQAELRESEATNV